MDSVISHMSHTGPGHVFIAQEPCYSSQFISKILLRLWQSVCASRYAVHPIRAIITATRSTLASLTNRSWVSLSTWVLIDSELIIWQIVTRVDSYRSHSLLTWHFRVLSAWWLKEVLKRCYCPNNHGHLNNAGRCDESDRHARCFSRGET
jgi:hypothetical protein